MQKVLIPVDGSANSLDAVRQVLRRALAEPLEAYLLNVQPLMTRRVARIVPSAARDGFRQEQAELAFAAARALLARHNVPTFEHVGLGEPAGMIAQAARQLHCDRIVIATARPRSISRIFDLAVIDKLRVNLSLPVDVVTGNAVSQAERVGIPVGIGTAIALLLSSMLD